MEPIIKVNNISKKYNISHQRGGYVALRDVLANIFKNPFRFAKNKTKQTLGMGGKEEFWALKNVNFEVNKGEVVGIIGRNGAGKSTLLKILSKITPPTTGEIRLKGRVGSLLEVGTGFHPELTGRENIFLNGAILGMTRAEIARKFNQIVEFAGIEKFLDTPVKHYSSGMYVRLAFSVAAHLEPDILIVDEVLAVGDMEFQKKCLGKMEEVTRKEGRTILFVSHNMGAIQKLCQRCILLDSGRIEMFDQTDKVVDFYLNSGKTLNSVSEFNINKSKDAQISKIAILDKNLRPSAKIPVSEKFYIDVSFSVFNRIASGNITIMFYSQGDLLLFSSESDKEGVLRDYNEGDYNTRIEIPAFLFNVGSYYFDAVIHKPNISSFDHKQNINFEISDVNNPRSVVYGGNNHGKISSILDYKTEKNVW